MMNFCAEVSQLVLVSAALPFACVILLQMRKNMQKGRKKKCSRILNFCDQNPNLKIFAEKIENLIQNFAAKLKCFIAAAQKMHTVIIIQKIKRPKITKSFWARELELLGKLNCTSSCESCMGNRRMPQFRSKCPF